ncbi:unnamed protein product [Gordionus sp. m RMFG-2023]
MYTLYLLCFFLVAASEAKKGQSEIFYPELVDISSKQISGKTGAQPHGAVKDYTKSLKVEALGKKFQVELSLYDSFISNLIVESLDIDFVDPSSRKKNKTIIKGSIYKAYDLLKGCIYKGRAVDLSNPDSSENETQYFKAVFNLCGGISGGILTDKNQYEITPANLKANNSKVNRQVAHCMVENPLRPIIPHTSYTSPKKLHKVAFKDETYKIELSIFIRRDKAGQPTLNEIITTAAMGIEFYAEERTINTFGNYLERYSQMYPTKHWDVAGLLSPLGAPHDPGYDAAGSEDCLQFKNQQRGIMGYGLLGEERYRWSECSRYFIRQNINTPAHRKCLLEIQNVDKGALPISQLPQKYTCSEFCKSMENTPKCSYTQSTCMRIVCVSAELSYIADTLDGIPCKGNLISPTRTGWECYQGKCLKAR